MEQLSDYEEQPATSRYCLRPRRRVNYTDAFPTPEETKAKRKGGKKKSTSSKSHIKNVKTNTHTKKTENEGSLTKTNDLTQGTGSPNPELPSVGGMDDCYVKLRRLNDNDLKDLLARYTRPQNLPQERKIENSEDPEIVLSTSSELLAKYTRPQNLRQQRKIDYCEDPEVVPTTSSEKRKSGKKRRWSLEPPIKNVKENIYTKKAKNDSPLRKTKVLRQEIGSPNLKLPSAGCMDDCYVKLRRLNDNDLKDLLAQYTRPQNSPLKRKIENSEDPEIVPSTSSDSHRQSGTSALEENPEPKNLKRVKTSPASNILPHTSKNNTNLLLRKRARDSKRFAQNVIEIASLCQKFENFSNSPNNDQTQGSFRKFNSDENQKGKTTTKDINQFNAKNPFAVKKWDKLKAKYASSQNAIGLPKTGCLTFPRSNVTEPEIGEISISGQQTGETSITEPQTGENTITGQETSETTITQQRTGEATTSNPETDENTFTGQETSETTITQQRTGEATTNNPETDENTITGQETSETTITQQRTGETTTNDLEIGEAGTAEPQTVETCITQPQTGEVTMTGQQTSEAIITEHQTGQITITQPQTEEIIIAEPRAGEATVKVCNAIQETDEQVFPQDGTELLQLEMMHSELYSETWHYIHPQEISQKHRDVAKSLITGFQEKQKRHKVYVTTVGASSQKYSDDELVKLHKEKHSTTNKCEEFYSSKDVLEIRINVDGPPLAAVLNMLPPSVVKVIRARESITVLYAMQNSHLNDIPENMAATDNNTCNVTQKTEQDMAVNTALSHNDTTPGEGDEAIVNGKNITNGNQVQTVSESDQIPLSRETENGAIVNAKENINDTEHKTNIQSENFSGSYKNNTKDSLHVENDDSQNKSPKDDLACVIHAAGRSENYASQEYTDDQMLEKSAKPKRNQYNSNGDFRMLKSYDPSTVNEKLDMLLDLQETNNKLEIYPSFSADQMAKCFYWIPPAHFETGRKYLYSMNPEHNILPSELFCSLFGMSDDRSPFQKDYEEFQFTRNQVLAWLSAEFVTNDVDMTNPLIKEKSIPQELRQYFKGYSLARDRSCGFHSLSFCISLDVRYSNILRRLCILELLSNKDANFSLLKFTPEEAQELEVLLVDDRAWLNSSGIKMLSHILERNIIVYKLSSENKIVGTSYTSKARKPPLYLYVKNNHFIPLLKFDNDLVPPFPIDITTALHSDSSS